MFSSVAFIEKPLTLNIDDAEKLVKMANENSVNLMVGHVLLFHPAIRKIKELINKEKIGKLQYIYSNRLNLGQVRVEENAFWSLAPHDIAIFQYYTESYPELIKAHGSAFFVGFPQYTTFSFPKMFRRFVATFSPKQWILNDFYMESAPQARF